MALSEKRLKQFHQSLYEKSRQEALSSPSFNSKTVQSYSNQFNSSLPKTFRITNPEEVLDSALASSIIIFGDFHTLKQTQKGFVRLLKALQIRTDHRNMAVFVEMFKAEDQESIDEFMAGRMSEDEFLSSIDYYKEWGFPWENYRLVVDYCRHHQIRVLGINTKRGGKDSLQKRDRFATNLMLDFQKSHPEHLLACLIGEFHLSDQSLPARFRHFGKSITRVFSNVDEYYFNPAINLSNQTEYLFLKDDTFCILNAPPWVKWQSYCIWEETRTSLGYEDAYEAIGEEEDSYTEECVDVDFQIQEMVRHLSGFLGFKLEPRDLSRFTLAHNPDHEVLDQLQSTHKLSKSGLNLAIDRLSDRGYYFDVTSDLILLTDFSFNNLAKITGQYIHSLGADYSVHKLPLEARFIFRCLSFASGEIANLILNPKVKSRSFEYFNSLHQSFYGKRLQGLAKNRRQAVRCLLAFNSSYKKRSPNSKKLRALCEQDRFLNHEISLYTGMLMGHVIYKKIMEYEVPFDLIQRLFLSAKDPHRLEDEFHYFYAKILMFDES